MGSKFFEYVIYPTLKVVANLIEYNLIIFAKLQKIKNYEWKWHLRAIVAVYMIWYIIEGVIVDRTMLPLSVNLISCALIWFAWKLAYKNRTNPNFAYFDEHGMIYIYKMMFNHSWAILLFVGIFRTIATAALLIEGSYVIAATSIAQEVFALGVVGPCMLVLDIMPRKTKTVWSSISEKVKSRQRTPVMAPVGV